MKELYQIAEMDVINFDMEDVIATSIETEPTGIIAPTAGPNTTFETDPIP